MTSHRPAPGPAPVLPQITTTDCRQCGTRIDGINGRYSCTRCGWISHWSEGDTVLPTAEDDPDWTGADQPTPRL